MPLDHYVTLGRSGLRVSPFCLGSMTFGEDLGWGSSVKESEQIINRYIDLGGNFIDTANFYTKSHSEKIIGDHVGFPAASGMIVEQVVAAVSRLSRRAETGDRSDGQRGALVVDQPHILLRLLIRDHIAECQGRRQGHRRNACTGKRARLAGC